MSYAKFSKQLREEIKQFPEDSGCPIDVKLLCEQIDEASRIVFDRWMSAERYEEIIPWFVKNFDSGGGDRFLQPLAAALKRHNLREPLRTLFRCAINTRERCYWNWSQQTSSPDSKERLPTLLSETTCAFEDYIKVLEELGPPAELEEVRDAYARFTRGKRSKLKRKFALDEVGGG